MSKVTARKQQVYDQFSEYFRKNPDATNAEALKKFKVSSSTLHEVKKVLGDPRNAKAKLPENIPPFMKRAYNNVTSYLKKNPDATIKEACEQTDIDPGAYYKAKQRINGTTKRTYTRRKAVKPESSFIDVEYNEDSQPEGKAVVIICDPSKVKSIVNTFL